MEDAKTTKLKLGLIGDNIGPSRAPHLHRVAGQLTGIDVRYDRLVPRDLRMDFDALFDGLREAGYRGVNITYPYKERAAARATVDDPHVRRIGAVNTVLFEPDGPKGFNTDCSGFIAAYRAARGTIRPGTVCLLGSGGVGRAVGFGLLALGATRLRCVDLDMAKARALAEDLSATGTDTGIAVVSDPVEAARDADGIVNCTPLGMAGIGGTPLPGPALRGAAWAFDAVYTPVWTPFLRDARDAGLRVITGYELFLGQGVDAWRLFSGRPVDVDAVRARLTDTPA